MASLTAQVFRELLLDSSSHQTYDAAESRAYFIRQNIARGTLLPPFRRRLACGLHVSIPFVHQRVAGRRRVIGAERSWLKIYNVPTPEKLLRRASTGASALDRRSPGM